MSHGQGAAISCRWAIFDANRRQLRGGRQVPTSGCYSLGCLTGRGNERQKITTAKSHFLAEHTEIVELTNDVGGRAVVCPAWQGRVMTSTCGGLQGPSFGFINREFIAAGKSDPHFNNYGGRADVALAQRPVQPLVRPGGASSWTTGLRRRG